MITTSHQNKKVPAYRVEKKALMKIALADTAMPRLRRCRPKAAAASPSPSWTG
jgi:hypothetical protein